MAEKSGKRGKVIIATKVGSDMGEGNTVRKDAILREADASLRRLQVDCIDLYQTHFDDEVLPVEETLSAYAQLIAQGKVRVIGVSNTSTQRLEASLAASKQSGLPRYESLQPLYNLYDRKKFETDYAPICTREHIGVITYYSLASGFLTGKYRSPTDSTKSAARGKRMKQYLDERGFRILKALDAIAASHRAKPVQISLAWLMARPGITAPIASATTMQQPADIIGAVSITLTAEDMQKLDQASAWFSPGDH